MEMRALVGLVFGLSACHREPMFNPAKEDTAILTVKKLALDAFRAWDRAHPDRPCPDRIDELVQYTDGKSIDDPWGHPYRLYCGASLPAGVQARLAVTSDGADGRQDTDDDVRSW